MGMRQANLGTTLLVEGGDLGAFVAKAGEKARRAAGALKRWWISPLLSSPFLGEELD
ncbi:MAG: hypothetical protein ABL866_11305 [Devosia sp.]